jgi:hypothetical protein
MGRTPLQRLCLETDTDDRAQARGRPMIIGSRLPSPHSVKPVAWNSAGPMMLPARAIGSVRNDRHRRAVTPDTPQRLAYWGERARWSRRFRHPRPSG